MYATCLRCERSLGTNTEIPHLSIGRRIAFDTTTGRLWVICQRCGQWNLTPIEERWETLAECDRLATAAEARAAGREVGLAHTSTGLELLRVGGMPNADIANWRYGRRLHARHRRQSWMFMALALLAAALGIGAARITGTPTAGVYLAVIMCVFLFSVWQNPPRRWLRVPDGAGGRRVLWPWDVQYVQFEPRHPNSDSPPALLVPVRGGNLRLQGHTAAAALAAVLPRINSAGCAGVRLQEVLDRVAEAETAAARPPRPPSRRQRRRAREQGRELPAPPRRRPWEHLAQSSFFAWLATAAP